MGTDTSNTGTFQAIKHFASFANPRISFCMKRTGLLAKALGEAIEYDYPTSLERAGWCQQLGFLTTPSSVLERIYSFDPLNEYEVRLVKDVAELGERVWGDLGGELEIGMGIRYSFAYFDGSGDVKEKVSRMDLPVAARILRLSLDYVVADNLSQQTMDPGAHPPFGYLRERRTRYEPKLMAELETLVQGGFSFPKEERWVTRVVPVEEVFYGMRLAADLYNVNRVLILAKGGMINQNTKSRILDLKESGQIGDFIEVEEKILV